MDTKSNNGLMQIALHYLLEYKWSVIPLCTPVNTERCIQHGQCNSPGKAALIAWAAFQLRMPTQEEVTQWWTKWPNANIGIVTGAISRLVVVDIEKEKGKPIDGLTPTLIARSGGEGWHYYYLHPGKVIKSRTGFLKYVDFKADGGYVVAPPSLHVSGERYSWIASPDDADLVEIPPAILAQVTNNNVNNSSNKNFDYYWNGVGEGERNTAACSVVGKLIQLERDESQWEKLVWPQVEKWNQTNRPPLSDNELLTIWRNMVDREKRKRNNPVQRESQKDQLHELLDNQTDLINLFLNDRQDPWATIIVKSHKENWSCSSSQFKWWLTNLYYEKFGKAPNTETINSAIALLSARARFGGVQYKTYNRVAKVGDVVWYDLASSDWRSVKITSQGWEVTSNPSVIFQRHSHQQQQMDPISGGDVKQVLQFINTTDPQLQVLLLVYLVACFIPGFPHPILNVYGSQGSAKTMLGRLFRKLIDPSSTEVLTIPKDIPGLVQMLDHNWFCLFDNLSRCSADVSDQLCKAVTGDGFSKRQHYTNDEDYIYTFQRPLGMNGINLVATKPDLLERSILCQLERIPPEQRKTEEELWNEFDKQKAHILGAVFDAVSKSIGNYESLKISNLPRMADFTKWGCAIAEALGFSKQEFLDAYLVNIDSQNEEVLNSSLLGTAIRKLMEDKPIWTGTTTLLQKELEKIADLEGINTHSDWDWPKSANAFSRKLNELKTTLATDGIYIDREHTGSSRIIRIRKQSNDINDKNLTSLTTNDIDDTNDRIPSLFSSNEEF